MRIKRFAFFINKERLKKDSKMASKIDLEYYLKVQNLLVKADLATLRKIEKFLTQKVPNVVATNSEIDTPDYNYGYMTPKIGVIKFIMADKYNTTSDKPVAKYKPTQYFKNLPEVKKHIKMGIKDMIEVTMEYEINNSYKYGSNTPFAFTKIIRYDNNDYYVYEEKEFRLWVCLNYIDHEAKSIISKLAEEFPEGTIFANSWGYSMILYDFYRIESYDKSSVTVSKLKKEFVNVNKDMGRPRVMPSDTIEETKKYKITVMGDKASIKLDYTNRLYFDKLYVYDSDKKYIEDHYD